MASDAVVVIPSQLGRFWTSKCSPGFWDPRCLSSCCHGPKRLDSYNTLRKYFFCFSLLPLFSPSVTENKLSCCFNSLAVMQGRANTHAHTSPRACRVHCLAHPAARSGAWRAAAARATVKHYCQNKQALLAGGLALRVVRKAASKADGDE